MTYKDSLQDFEEWHLHYVPWWWWGVRLIDGRKVRGRPVMRKFISGEWRYRELMDSSEMRNAMRVFG